MSTVLKIDTCAWRSNAQIAAQVRCVAHGYGLLPTAYRSHFCLSPHRLNSS